MISTRRSLAYLALFDYHTSVWYTQYPSQPDFSSGIQWVLPSHIPALFSSACVSCPHKPMSRLSDAHVCVRGRVVDVVARDVALLARNLQDVYFEPAEVLGLRGICGAAWRVVGKYYPPHALCYTPLSPSSTSSTSEDDGEEGVRGEEEQPDTIFHPAFILDVIDTLFYNTVTGGPHSVLTPIQLTPSASPEHIYKLIIVLLRLSDATRPFEDSKKEELEAVKKELAKRAVGMAGRRFVVLRSGRMALVQKGVRIGDRVVVLHGLDTVGAVRRCRGEEGKGEDGREGEEGWRWMGDAYVKGMMRGEVCDWEEDEADVFRLV